MKKILLLCMVILLLCWGISFAAKTVIADKTDTSAKVEKTTLNGESKDDPNIQNRPEIPELPAAVSRTVSVESITKTAEEPQKKQELMLDQDQLEKQAEDAKLIEIQRAKEAQDEAAEALPPSDAEINPDQQLVKVEGPPLPPSQQGTILQGSDNCTNFNDLGSALPATEHGTTVGYANNYGPFTSAPPGWQGTWLSSAAAGPDVVCKWTAPVEDNYIFSLCGTSYDCVLLLYNFTCPTEPTVADFIAGNDDNGGCTTYNNSQINNIHLTAGQAVLVVVDAYSTNSGAYTLNITAVPPPSPGDNCGNLLTVNIPEQLPYTDQNHTCYRVDDYNATCLGTYDTKDDIIYQINVSQDGSYNFVMSTTTTYTGIALSADCSDFANCIAFNTLTGAGSHGLINLALTAGTYYLIIDSQTSCMTAFTLNISQCPSPPVSGDNCDNPIPVTVPDVGLPYTDVNSTLCMANDYANTCNGSYDTGNDAVYQINVNQDGCYNFMLNPGSSTYASIALSQDCSDFSSCIAYMYNSSATLFGLQRIHLSAGQYYLLVDSYATYSPYLGTYTVSIDTCPSPLPGETCESPIDITLPAELPYTNDNTTCGFFNDYSNTCLGSYDGGEDIIYRLNVTESSAYNFELNPGTSTWSGIALDDACPFDPTTCIAMHTSSSAAPHGFTNITLDPGTYYLMIDTWPSPACIPAFTLNITECTAPPANDNCANAQVIGNVTDLEFSTRCATFDGAGACMTGNNLWYRYTATCTGVATFSLCGSSYDTKLAVYDGTECPETNLPPDPVELQAGEDISTAVAIPSLPVKLTGTTAGYLYDYDPSCGGTGVAPDVVYSYTPASDIYAYLELCGTTWDTRMTILDGDGNELGCNDDHCSLQSGFDNFAMSAGVTYYIVIGGYGTNEGSYLFTMYTTNYILLGCNDNFCSNQSELHIPVVSGTEYLIEVGGYSLSAGSGLLNVRCELPPPNDDCANATPIGNVTDLAFSTTSATHDGSDTWIASPNIWYIYTPTCTGLATFSLCGSAFDTKLVVYDGATCDPLPDTLGRDDDLCDPGLQSVVYKSVIEGNQYLIEVGGYSATTIGDGVISTSCDLPPVNDNCESVNPADNVLISEVPVVFTGNNSAASNDCPQGVFADTWFAFTTTECMNVVINSCGMDPNLTNTVGLRLYDSCPCGAYITATSNNWTDCGDDNWTLYFDRLPAGSYYYAIYSNPPTGPYSFTVTGVTCPPPVDGESCEHPLTIALTPGVPYVTDGTTCGMWNDYSNTCLGTYDGGEDAIYQVTIPSDGCYSFTLDPQGTTYTGIALDYACPPDPTTCIAYNTSYSAIAHGFRADLVAGTYWLMIDSYSYYTACIPAFTLTIQECPPPPVNDHCDAAILLDVPSVTDGSTESADMDSDFPTCTTTITGPGVWYKVMGTGNTMTATTCNAVTAYDTKLNVYCYTCDQPICVAGNDDACSAYSLRSTVSWCSDPTATYLILVQGFSAHYGVYELELTDDGIPCTGAIACGYPGFAIDPTSVQMTLPPNGSGTQPLTITNTGDATLTGTVYVTVTGPAPSPLLRPSTPDSRSQISNEQIAPLKVDDGAVSNPDPRVILQGGDNCANAFDLGNTVPVSDAGTTTGYTHNYGPFTARPTCWQGNWYINSSASLDVVYKWTAPFDSTYTFSLCGSGYDTGLLLYNYTCPTEPTEADLICGNDDASTCASTLRSELTNISLTAGQEVLVVVGGYSAGNGAYSLEISAYTPPPPPPGCPDDGSTIVGQAPTLSTEAWSFGNTDVDGGYIRYDNFAGLSSEINEIHFWGIQGYYDGSAWSVCSTDPESFQIIFYNDNGGVPGDIINTFDVSISPVPTGNSFVVGSVSFDQMEFVTALPSTVRLFRGWVSIQGVSTGDNCWFLWQNSLSADHISLLSADGGGTFTTNTYDLAMCLVGSNFTPWLSVDPVTFNVPAGGNTVINAHANAGGLAPGVYNGAVRIHDNVLTDPFAVVPVQLTVSPMGIIQGIAYNVDGVTSLPNVHVVTYDAGNVVVDDQVSNAVGIWSVALAPGTYHEHLTKTGFIPADISNIIVTVGSTTNVSFNMQLNTQGGCHYKIGDANASGTFTGLDVTYSVRYFKGGPHPPYICECTPGNTWYVSGDVNGSCTFSGLDVTYMVRYFKGGAAPICCASCPPVPDILKLSPNSVDDGLQDGAGQ